MSFLFSGGLFDVIPDSEANQKLIHRWYLSEDSSPFIDQIGAADSTSVTGTTQVTGNWVDGAARTADGVDDVIETTTWGSFGSEMANDWAIGFSMSTTDGIESHFMGVYNNDKTYLQIAMGHASASEGQIIVLLQDSAENVLLEMTNATFDDGQPYRVVVNKIGNSAGGIDIYVNQLDVNQTNAGDSGFSSPTNFEYPVPFYARNDVGTIGKYQNSTIDDICVFNNSLTASEIASYQNPWS